MSDLPTCPCCEIEMEVRNDSTVGRNDRFGFQCPQCLMIQHPNSNYHPITDKEREEYMSREIDPPSDEEIARDRRGRYL